MSSRWYATLHVTLSLSGRSEPDVRISRLS
uniref:Uncharacterized protein n=1 Tax=Siphoviridae sp. ctLgc23 TaxID=2825455 RepID=A0A8S5QIN4_9CAUD|nr:MAG TPA: hypothetical protein [Siphoviridae sp. ctLgc23]